MTALTHVLRTESPEQTRALGAQIGRLATPGLVIALSGDLGAGKTTFTQGLAHGLGVTTPVTSPTFTLVAEYDARAGMRLIHMDSYRLGDLPADAALEAETFGFEDLLDDPAAVLVIEWAERLAALLPPEPTADSVTPVVTVQNYTVDTSAQISVTRMDSTMTFSTTPNAVWSAGTWTSGASNGATTRTHKITVIRPIVP